MLSVVRFRVHGEMTPDLIRAVRVYQRRTRAEEGSVRCELCRSRSDASEYALLESFRDGHARTLHALAAHTLAFREVLSSAVVGAITEEELETVIADATPPALPVRLRPAVESSSTHGTGLREATASAAPEQAAATISRLTVDVEAIEVAAARDHIPLRSPQPCVVLGAFVVDGGSSHGLGRSVYRFAPSSSLPGRLVGSQRLLDVPLLAARASLKVALATISVEENGGRDVQAIYQALADANDLEFWTQSEQCPSPVSLCELASSGAFRDTAQRVQVLRRAATLSDTLTDDTWAGAALGYFDLGAQRRDVLARFHTTSEDGKNDWLLTLRCRVW